MKRLLLIALFCVLPAPANAAPKWLKRTAQIVVYAAPVATSFWATHEGHLCRQRTDVAFCSGGYGPFAARETFVRGGLSITFTGLSLWGHKQGYKEWFAPAVGMATFNSVIAIQQSKVPRGKE